MQKERGVSVYRRDLWNWKVILAAAVVFGVAVEAAWFYLPRSVRDFGILLPCLLPLIMYRRFGGWTISILYGAVAGLAVGLTRRAWLGNLSFLFSWRWIEFVLETLLPVFVLACGCLILRGLARLIFGRLLIREDESHCPDCGYCLIGNVSGRCPECGRAVEGEPAALSEV